MKKNLVKTRTWLLYVCIVVLLVSIGILTYRFIDGVGGVTGGGVAVNYDDTDPVEIYDSEYYANLKRSSGIILSWSGKQDGTVLRWVMEDLIEHNKIYKGEPVQLIFGNINCGGNVTCITNKARTIIDAASYEISYEYNSNGQIYLMRVEGGGIFCSSLIIPITMAVLIVLIFFNIMRMAIKNRKSVEKMIGGNHGLKF